jgi:uncharacterized integral membrane protein
MQVFLVLALAVALVAVLFALQNIVPVSVTFMTWTVEGSLALVLFVALIVGALVSLLASIPAVVKGRMTATSLRKQVAVLEAELESCRRGLAAARTPAGRDPAGPGGMPPHAKPPAP